MLSSIGSPAAFRSPLRAGDLGRDEGFTLIEVIVAFAVAALLMVVLSRALGLGVVGAARVKSEEDAAILAESTLDSLGVITTLKDGDTADLDRGAYRVYVSVDRYDDPDARRAQGYLALYRLSVTVRWIEARQKRSLTLTTLRFGSQG